jgi:hypothetical protein
VGLELELEWKTRVPCIMPSTAPPLVGLIDGGSELGTRGAERELTLTVSSRSSRPMGKRQTALLSTGISWWSAMHAAASRPGIHHSPVGLDPIELARCARYS